MGVDGHLVRCARGPSCRGAAVADADGLFTVDFGVMILPGAFSPTSSDVELSLVLTATGGDEAAFCGDVTGDVIEFETPVTMSTFAAVPRGTEGPMTASACGTGAGFEPIAECPELVAGDNTGFVSGGIERNFRVFTPEGYDPAQAWPVIFAYHGKNGGAPPWEGIDQFIMESSVPAATQVGGAILVLPASQGIGSEWESGSFESTRDLVFFDDMVTCVQAAFNVDPDRIHVAGHSAGAFHAALLSISRPDVIASTAIVSGGFLTEYVAPSRTMPYLILWGGEEDISFNQNFDVLTHASVATLTDGGHHLIRCDHSELPLEGDDSRHTWPDVASTWVTDFLLAHPMGVDPLPYADGVFPEGWLSSCAVGAFE